MPRIFIIIVAFLCFFTDIYSQSKPSWYVSVDNGVSIPVGKFANKEYKNKSFPKSDVNGLALPGFQFNLSGGYLINRSIFIHGQIGYAINKQDPSSYEEFFSKGLANPYTVTVNEQSWKVFKAVAGLKAQQYIGDRKVFFIEEKILAGIAKTKEPGFKVQTVSGTPPQIQATSQELSTINIPVAFAWQLDMGVGYNINKKIFLLVDMSYFDSRPQYKFIFYPPSSSSQSPFDSRFVYRLSNLGLTASFGIRF